MGDIYHLCLMRLSEHLTEAGVPITDEKSKWMSITAKECEEFVSEFIDTEGAEYKEGILTGGAEEKYKASRMKKVCTETAMIMIDHVQKGQIEDILFEAEFRRNEEKKIPAIKVQTDC